MKQNSKKSSAHPFEMRECHTESAGLFFKTGRILCRLTSPFQKIEIFENPTYGRVLMLDGLVQTTEKDEHFYHEMLVHPALASHPEPQDILVIGGGDGGVLKEIYKYPIRECCLVEIDALVMEAAEKYFPWLPQVKGKKGLSLIVEDGRKFIEQTDRMFDVVIIDSSDPVGPSSVLHEKTFFERIKKRLNPSGIVAGQMGSPLFDLPEIKKKQGFFLNIFPVVRFYTGPVPTYPGGLWSYVFLSEKARPLDIRREPPPDLKFYTREVHEAAFALPQFMKDELSDKKPAD
jgi:spermidine synthase